MARPQKQGLDYFPLDVVFTDDKVDLIEAEHGVEGFAILIKLWQKIYQNGYYIPWNDDVELLFARKINSEKTKVSSVINSCLLRNLFNVKTYKKYGILTSFGIQKRYIAACVSSRRKNIEFIEEYFLLEESYKKVITVFTRLNTEETTINSEQTQNKLGFTHEESTQRERESKEKGKEKEERKQNSSPSDLPPVEKVYQDNIGLITPIITESISHWLNEGFEEALLIRYIEVAVKRNKKSWGYVEKMIRGNLEKHVKTLEQYEAMSKENDTTRLPEAVNGNIFDQIGKERGYWK